MEIKGNKAILDHLDLRALASVGAMALGNKRLAELILKNQFELKKFNEEIREIDYSVCQCKHLKIVIYGQVCDICGGVITEQTEGERT